MQSFLTSKRSRVQKVWSNTIKSEIDQAQHPRQYDWDSQAQNWSSLIRYCKNWISRTLPSPAFTKFKLLFFPSGLKYTVTRSQTVCKALWQGVLMFSTLSSIDTYGYTKIQMYMCLPEHLRQLDNSKETRCTNNSIMDLSRLSSSDNAETMLQ